MANVDTIWNKILIDERTQGRLIGIEKERKKNEQERKEERKKFIAVLLKRGDSVEEIARAMEIPIKEVKTAKKELGL